MKISECFAEIVSQFLDCFWSLKYNHIFTVACCMDVEIEFYSQQTNRKINFAIFGEDVELVIYKPSFLFTLSDIFSIPDKTNKHGFSMHHVVPYVPNNNLLQFDRYEYFDYEKNMCTTEFYKRIKEKGKNMPSESERKMMFQHCVSEHIYFLKNHLYDIVAGKIWLDEWIQQQKLLANVT